MQTTRTHYQRYRLIGSLLFQMGIAGSVIGQGQTNPASTWDFRGQLELSGSLSRYQQIWSRRGTARYLPSIEYQHQLSEARTLGADFSVILFADSIKKPAPENVDLYRLSFRYATPQSEWQFGLQKINFGPAQILRSLMWFDRLDIRDPLKATTGVWGLRWRYNYLNNANAWLWVLYGNDGTKGMETVPTAQGRPELGGRFQIPVRSGEVAMTIHQRALAKPFDKDETRVAFDGRWDFILGWWLEAVWHNNSPDLKYAVTGGVDYTFGIGNGLYTILEHKTNFFPTSNRFPEMNLTGLTHWHGYDLLKVSALMLTYPLTLFDNLVAVGYYSWATNEFFEYLGWQRTFDRVIINLSFFNYPGPTLATGKMAGSGAQLMLIYNH